MDVTINDVSGTLIDTQLVNWDGVATDRNYGASAAIQSNHYGTGEIASPMFRVDLSVYSSIEVLDARFGIVIYAGLFDLTIDWHEVLVDWIEGTKDGATAGAGEPCWDWREYNTTAWGTAGCTGDGVDRNGTPDGSATITGTSSDYHLPITNALAQKWINSDSNNHGVIVPVQTPVSSRYIFIRSSENANKPYFYMEYTESPTYYGIPRNKIVNFGGV